MGRDYPYYCLWRLLEPEQLSTFDAFGAYPADARKRHFIRRTKEEMVRFDGTPIYPKRVSDTLSYDLTQGIISEQRLYDETTAYIETYYNRARILNRSAARLAMSIFQRRLASSTYALMRSFERRIEKLDLAVRKAHRDEDRKELELLRKCLRALEREVPLRDLEFSEEESKRLRGFTFLSLKPLLVVVNADEADAPLLAGGAPSFGLEAAAARPATEIVCLSAKIEAEIAELEPEEARAFRADLGIREPALERMIRASYRLLGRISFFTVGDDECRAWTIRRGTHARPAAGTVHSDIERGFIRAELVAYDDLVAAGTWAACRDRGTLRLEGKDYVVRDGDVINFRFGV